MTGRLLTGSLAFESRILHYLIMRILLPRSSNLAQVSEEDLIIMWAFHTGRQLDWAHLVRYRMHKALRLNAPLPYPQLVTLFLRHFEIPLDSESYIPIKRSFLIGAAAIVSFGYRKERDGSWVKNGAQPNDDEGQLLVEVDSSLLQSILDRFNGLQTYVGERFDALERQVDTRFDEMDSRITKVEKDVTIIRGCLDLPPPSPSV